MDALEFMQRYNARVDAMGAGARVKCLGITEKTTYTKQGSDEKAGEACLMATKTQAVSIVHIGGAIQGCIVYSPMSPDKVTDGLVAYSACLDVMTGLNEKRRNKLLQKLHLFDGKLTAAGSNCTAGEWMVEIRPGDPGRGWISFALVDAAAGGVPEVLDRRDLVIELNT